MSNRDVHEIREFLSRPIKLVTTTWSTSSATGETLQKIDLLGDLADDVNLADVFTSKLRGFLGFRGTARIRIQVNAQPFQTGSLIAAYFPLYNKMQKHYAAVADTSSLTPITYASGGPHAILDIAQETDITIDCPYIAPHNWYNLVSNDSTWGSVFIKVMAPLRSIATSIMYVNVYLSFHDIELYGATSLPVKYQGPDGPTRERQQAQQSGVVSGIASKVSSIAKTLSTSIPLLGDIAGPVSWASDVIGAGARLFGFSKPTNLAPVNGFKQQPTKYNAVCDGESHSHPMGIMSNSSLQTVNFAGCEEDEMHFNHILKRPSVRDSFDWKTSNVQGDILWQTFITPVAGPNFVNSEDKNAWQPILMTYLALAFKQWTGSLNYRFQFFLNNFYSGRLRFVFVPGDVSIALTKADLVSAYNSYTIVDMRSKSSFELNVPYIATTPYKLVEPIASSSAQLGNMEAYQLNNATTGRLYVVVEEPLRAPDTVSNTISCFVHQWAGDDFQLSVPKQPAYSPNVGLETLRRDTFYSEETEVHYQGLLDSVPSGETQPTSIMKNDPMPPRLNKAVACVGEHVESLRFLLKRFMAFGEPRIMRSTPVTGYHEENFFIPHYLTWDSTALPTDAAQNNDTESNGTPCDYISYFSQMFSFRRGGVRIQFQGASQDDKVGVSWNYTPLSGRFLTNNSATWNPPEFGIMAKDVPDRTFRPSNLVDYASDDLIYPLAQDLEGLFDLEIPYYSDVPFVVNSRFASSVFSFPGAKNKPFAGTVAFDAHYLPYGLLRFHTALQSKSALFRAAAEDFSFGFLHGAPPIIRTRQNLHWAFVPPTPSMT